MRGAGRPQGSGRADGSGQDDRLVVELGQLCPSGPWGAVGVRTWLRVSPVGVADIMRGQLCVGWGEAGTWGNTHPCVGRCPGASVEGKAEKGFTARGLSRVWEEAVALGRRGLVGDGAGALGVELWPDQ